MFRLLPTGLKSTAAQRPDQPFTSTRFLFETIVKADLAAILFGDLC